MEAAKDPYAHAGGRGCGSGGDDEAVVGGGESHGGLRQSRAPLGAGASLEWRKDRAGPHVSVYVKGALNK